MVQIKKRNGSLQDFQNEKLVNSCIKAGASKEVAEKIANEISEKIREGISTSEIRTMVISSLQSANAAWADAYSKYVKPSA